MTNINNYILHEMQDLSTMISCFQQAISPPEPIAPQLLQYYQQYSNMQDPNMMNQQDPNTQDPNGINQQDLNMQDPNQEPS